MLFGGTLAVAGLAATLSHVSASDQPAAQPAIASLRIAATPQVARVPETTVQARSSSIAASDTAAPIDTASVNPETLADLLTFSPESLAEVDIALVNLLCATGLPGSEGLDIAAARRTLDLWALAVKYETERHLYRVTDPRWAEHYRHSESYLRASFLLQTLQEQCGVKYNPARIDDWDCRDSRDQFIHGMMNGNAGGTCVSMPVMYIAVGRRLGYPLRLVQAKGHLFCRWDDPAGERFNIDGAGEGMGVYADEHYQTWPTPISDEEVARGEFLRSLSPSEELAVFLGARGHCLVDNGRHAEALEWYRQAFHRLPTPQYQDWVNVTEGILAGRLIPVNMNGEPIQTR